MSENTTTYSVPIAELSLEQLVQLSQGLGHEIEQRRAQRAYLRRKIDERLAAGERTSTQGDAVAPGVVIEASAKG